VAGAAAEKLANTVSMISKQSSPWRKAWQRAPRAARLLAYAQLTMIMSILSVALVVSELSVDPGTHTIALALPATQSESMPWQTEVDAFGHKVSQAFGVHRQTATEFAPWILEAARRQSIDPELLASLVLTESSFRKNAVSHVGAIGPAQVRPEYWSGFCGSNDLHDPAENIYCGAQVLSHLQERCGNEACAVKAYNVGIHSAKHDAAARYASKIDRYREQLRELPL
jgi:soluble lytic murein transglycosylase-like protein